MRWRSGAARRGAACALPAASVARMMRDSELEQLVVQYLKRRK